MPKIRAELVDNGRFEFVELGVAFRWTKVGFDVVFHVGQTSVTLIRVFAVERRQLSDERRQPTVDLPSTMQLELRLAH